MAVFYLAGSFMALLTLSLFSATWDVILCFLTLLSNVWLGEDAIDCYSCHKVDEIDNCHTVKQCPEKVTECIAYSVGSGDNMTYTLGCDTQEQCLRTTATSPTSTITTVLSTLSATMTSVRSPTKHNSNAIDVSINIQLSSTTPTANATAISSKLVSGPPSIVGRRANGVTARAKMSCENQCCSSDACNKYLCPQEEIVSGECLDKPSFDCETADKVLHVCDNIDNAKTICKKHCGLCDLVDGGWSDWSNWTMCDVTCGNGTQMRTRKCDNPTPAHNGSDCVGDDTEHKECEQRRCPLDGDWSNWSTWSGCSVACGVGLQRRDRNCSDPFPDPNGQNCFGDSRDDRVCVEKACHEDVWKAWSEWSNCSTSCGVGQKTRERECSAQWSLLDKPCIGDMHETVLCNGEDCTGSDSAFLVSGIPVNGSKNRSIKLTFIITNVGRDYNSTTGQFICRIPGVYNFFVSIEKQLDVGEAFCHLMKNDNPTIAIAVNPGIGSSYSYQQSSNAAVLKLDSGDAVYLGMCSLPSTMTKHSTFSGYLVRSE